jgi:diguanylate cyclase (GGDEF)-like protein
LDIDHFKRINDLAGHSAGDRALCQVADLLRRQARQSDTVARLGGEEFVLLMPDTSAEGALGLAQRLQSELAVLGLPMPEAHGQQAAPGTLTVSIGLCTRVEFSGDPADLVAQADQAMYQAKREGRNRIVVSGASPGQRSSRFPDLAAAA